MTESGEGLIGDIFGVKVPDEPKGYDDLPPHVDAPKLVDPEEEVATSDLRIVRESEYEVIPTHVSGVGELWVALDPRHLKKD